MITDTTTIGIGLVITLMSAAASFGIMWQKVSNLQSDVDDLTTDIKELIFISMRGKMTKVAKKPVKKMVKGMKKMVKKMGKKMLKKY